MTQYWPGIVAVPDRRTAFPATASTWSRTLQLGDRFQQRHRIRRRELLDGQARQRQAGDVDLFDRSPGILQAIDGRLGDELEAGGAQFFEERAQRDAVAGKAVLLSGTATIPGQYCVVIYDLGNLVEPAVYTINVLHS